MCFLKQSFRVILRFSKSFLFAFVVNAYIFRWIDLLDSTELDPTEIKYHFVSFEPLRSILTGSEVVTEVIREKLPQ